MPRIVQSAARRSSKRTNASLWTIQALLALVFLFAGGMKLVVPIEMLKGPVALPGAFMRFIGVCETLGALGLILPGVFRIRTALTPLAASGLVIIMIGATTVTLIGGLVAPALVPVIVGTLASLVAYGRWRVAPLAVRPARSAATIEASQTVAPRRAA
ncbi:MAG TPA: DoxX family protein [Gemmatimonadales bacterium]|jgi:DoxX-like protein|nr:DoxX family protein [Gemmatimonadales bacterium]